MSHEDMQQLFEIIFDMANI